MTFPIINTEASREAALLPCPFCGGKAQARLDHDHSTAWIVECMTKPSCPIHDREIYGLTKNAAIAAWNTRATPQPPLLEELQEAMEALVAAADAPIPMAVGSIKTGELARVSAARLGVALLQHLPTIRTALTRSRQNGEG